MSGFIEDDAYPLVPEASALGNLGEEAFSFLARRIGFGLAPNPTDDNGNTIDRFVFVTEPAEGGRRRQLGLITAQVKTGDSAFNSATDDGWWHTMSAREATVPLGKPLGHIIVLVEPETPIAYWAELTSQSRVPTGRGFKLFIPATQTISYDCAEALRDVWRKAQMKRRSWTQSSWIAPGEAPIADDDDRLVAAILTPRLVAPHPNLLRPGRGPVLPEQAVALICAGRIPELEDNLMRFRTDAEPTFDAMVDHHNWRWRLAAALADHPHLADDRLNELTDAAGDPTGRAVVAVVHATWLARRDRLAEADGVLEAASGRATGLVAAWLLVQRARFVRRLSNREAAVELLDAALPHVAFDDRPWATALTAAVMSAKLSADTLDGDAAARAVAASDNEQAWWAAQVRSSILDDHLTTQMTQFMPSGSVRFAFEDVAANRARGLVLAADLAGNEGRYRYELRLAGRDRATTHPGNPKELAVALDMLRQAGEHSDVANLVRRIRELDGDDELVRRWTEIANFALWTRPVAANTAFARGVVGLIDDDAVHEWVMQLADHFESGGRSVPSVDLDAAIAMATAAIRVAGPDEQLVLFDAAIGAVERFMPEARVGDEAARLIEALETDCVAVRAEVVAAAMERAVSYQFEIAVSLDEAGVEAGAAVVERLASAGDLRAVAYLLHRQRDVSFVDPALVADHVRSAIAFVSNGARAFGGGASDFTLAGLWAAHTSDPLVTSMLAGLLTDPAAAGDHKCDVLLGLLGVGDLPTEVIEQVYGVAHAIVVPHRWDPEVSQVSEFALRSAAAALGTRLESLDVAAIMRMLGSTNELDRELGARLAHRWAAYRNERELVIAVLSPLLSDPEQAIRQLVARLSADLACDDVQAAGVLRSTLPNLRRTEHRAMLALLIGKERSGSIGATALIDDISLEMHQSTDHASARLLRRRARS